MKGQIEVPKCPEPGPQGPCGRPDGRRTAGNPEAPPPDGMIGPNERIPRPAGRAAAA